jgi:hypothetical protein
MTKSAHMCRGAMSKINDNYDEIVIGSGLNAALFSFFKSIPLVSLRAERPLSFEHFDPATDLTKLFFDPQESVLQTPTGAITVGVPKEQVWANIMFALGSAGLVLGSDRVLSMRVDTNKSELWTLTLQNALKSSTFKKLYIFNDADLRGLDPPEKFADRFEVVDYINVAACGAINFDLIQTEDDFVKDIYFINSKRPNRDKDIVCRSYLTNSQLIAFDYSDTMVKFKIKSLMETVGIKGPRNGHAPNNPEEYRYHNIKLDTAYRRITKAHMCPRHDTPNMCFVDLDSNFIINNFNADPKSYQCKALKLINAQRGK